MPPKVFITPFNNSTVLTIHTNSTRLPPLEILQRSRDANRVCVEVAKVSVINGGHDDFLVENGPRAVGVWFRRMSRGETRTRSDSWSWIWGRGERGGKRDGEKDQCQEGEKHHVAFCYPRVG